MAEPIIQLIFQGRILETIKLTKEVTTVGRMTNNDIVINNLGVSRQHCKILRDEDGAFHIEDLGSANGIRVNGVQLPKSPLYNGDEIMVGKHKLIFQIAERGVAGFFKSDEAKAASPWVGDRTIVTSAPPTPPQAPPSTPSSTPPPPEIAPSPRMVFPAGEGITSDTIQPAQPATPKADEVPREKYDHKVFEYVLKWSEFGVKVTFEGKIISVHALKKSSVTVGRGQENDVVIDNLGVSRLHARIYVEDGQHFVEDQGSANGIRVNGVSVKKSPLYPGDEVLVGKHILTFDLSKRLMAGVEPEDIRRPVGGVHWPMETYPVLPPQDAAASPPQPGDEGTPSDAPQQQPDEAAPAELEAWQGKYAVKVMLDGREVGTFAITKRVTCVGRLKENDIVIDNLGVSRLHAKIMIEDNGQCYVEDQDSANGIIVNGLPLRRSPLYPGDEIIIVKHKLIFDLSHKSKPTQKAGGGVVSLDPWSQDSTMMVSEADRERLRKQWAERAAKEKADKESGKQATPPPPAKPVTPAPAPKPEVKLAAPQSRPEPTPPPKVDTVAAEPVKESPKAAPVEDRSLIDTAPSREPVHRIGKIILQDGADIKLSKDKFVIGKSSDADLRVGGGWIKKEHAVIIREESISYRLVCKSLFKRPKVNDQTAINIVLKSGDVVTIGDVTFTFQYFWEE